MKEKRKFVAAKICQFINDQQLAGSIGITEKGAEALEIFLNDMLQKEIRDLDNAYWTARTSGVDHELTFATFLQENYEIPKK